MNDKKRFPERGEKKRTAEPNELEKDQPTERDRERTRETHVHCDICLDHA